MFLSTRCWSWPRAGLGTRQSKDLWKGKGVQLCLYAFTMPSLANLSKLSALSARAMLVAFFYFTSYICGYQTRTPLNSPTPAVGRFSSLSACHIHISLFVLSTAALTVLNSYEPSIMTATTISTSLHTTSLISSGSHHISATPARAPPSSSTSDTPFFPTPSTSHPPVNSSQARNHITGVRGIFFF